MSPWTPRASRVGSAETLLDGAVRLAGVAGGDDVPVQLTIWPEMVHAFPLFFPRLAAGRRALEEAGQFIRARLAGS